MTIRDAYAGASDYGKITAPAGVLTFWDTATGTKTLAELASGGGGSGVFDDLTIATNLTISDSDLPTLETLDSKDLQLKPAGSWLWIGGSADIAPIAEDVSALGAESYRFTYLWLSQDIDCEGDMQLDGALTCGSASLGTGELTCGSINRVADSLTLEIGGTAIVTLTSNACDINKDTDFNNKVLTNVNEIHGGDADFSGDLDVLGDVMFSGQPSGLIEKTTTRQTITTGTWTQVTFNTEDYDVGFDFGSNQFVVPADGVYLVCWSTGYFGTCVANKKYIGQLRINGSATVADRKARHHAAYASSVTPNGSVILSLETSDTLQLWVYHDSGANCDIDASGEVFLSVHRLA